FLQVMAGNIGELFQIAIDAREVLVGAHQIPIAVGEFGEEIADLVLVAAGAERGPHAADERYGAQRAIEQSDISERLQQMELVTAGGGGGSSGGHDNDREIGPGRLI